MVTIVILLGALSQTPPQTIPEIRRTLNRFDELDNIALDATAKKAVKTLTKLPNAERRTKICQILGDFAEKSLDITPPWTAGEVSMMENLADDAAKPHDFQPVKAAPPPPPKKQWFQTPSGPIWGWRDAATGIIYYNPVEYWPG